MQNNWLSIIPPVIVLLLAFTTRRVILSLLSGIISAALILNNFALYKTLKTVISKIWATSELGSLQSFDAFKNNWSLFICLFLLMLGMVIVLVNHSGGAYAYGNYIKKKLKKQSYLFICNNINTYEFENFGLDSWVNTACPRMDMEDNKIINIDKLNLGNRKN